MKTSALYDSAKHLSTVKSINDEGLVSSVAPISIEQIYGLAGKSQVLAWIPFVDTYSEYPNTLNAISQYYTDYTLTETTTIDTLALSGLLSNADVFLIPNQQGMYPSYYQSLGVSWSNVLEDFVNRGGVIILCGGTSYRASQEIYNSGGLMSMSYYTNYSNGVNLSINDTTHYLTSELKKPLLTQSYTSLMNVSDLDTKVLINQNGYATLAVKELGLGSLIYIGYNYYSYDNNSASIIANAVSSERRFSWAKLSEQSGVIPAGASERLEVTIDASKLRTGDHQSSILVNSNDPNKSEQHIPVTLRVKGHGVLFSSFNEFNLGGVPVGEILGSELGIFNIGTDTLFVSQIESSLKDFAIDTSMLFLLPDQSAEIAFHFSPSRIRNESAIFSIYSNDRKSPVSLIKVKGHGVFPIRNVAPIFKDSILAFSENLPNKSVLLQLDAIDLNGDTLDYTITSGNSAQAFALSSSGQLSLLDSAQFDFETTPVYELKVEVSDGSLTSAATVTINLENVNEFPVIFSQQFLLSENSKTGTLIGQFIASDVDSQILTYTITSGNSMQGFVLSNSGELSVLDSAQFDFETNSVHELAVEVSDGSLTSIATVIINIENVNESPIIESQTFELLENSAQGVEIGSMVGSDADGDQLQYSILQGNKDNVFTLSNSGLLSVNESEKLDFEFSDRFEIYVQVTDGAMTANAVITIILINVLDLSLSNEIEYVIYPNPSDSHINIESASRIKLIELVDLTGKVVFTKAPDAEKIVTVDLTGFLPGIYHIMISDGGNNTIKRVIKQ